MGNKEKENVGVSGRRKRVTTPRGVVHAGRQIVRVRHIDGTKKTEMGAERTHHGAMVAGGTGEGNKKKRNLIVACRKNKGAQHAVGLID